MAFGPYDLVVLLALVVGFIHGRTKGLSWQLSGIATLALGYLAATAGAAVLFPLFPDAWPVDLKKFSAWLATYALVTAGVYFVTLRLSKKIKEHELEELDRRFGGALGVMKAGLLLSVVSLVAVATSERARSLVKESASGQVLARAAYAARPLLPDKIASAVGEIAGKIVPEPAPQPSRPAPKPTVPAQPVPVPPRPVVGTHRLDPPAPPPPPPPPPPVADEDHEDPMDPPDPPDPLAPPPRR